MYAEHHLVAALDAALDVHDLRLHADDVAVDIGRLREHGPLGDAVALDRDRRRREGQRALFGLRESGQRAPRRSRRGRGAQQHDVATVALGWAGYTFRVSWPWIVLLVLAAAVVIAAFVPRGQGRRCRRASTARAEPAQGELQGDPLRGGGVRRERPARPRRAPRRSRRWAGLPPLPVAGRASRPAEPRAARQVLAESAQRTVKVVCRIRVLGRIRPTFSMFRDSW